MKRSKPPEPKPTIRCRVMLDGTFLTLPKSASAKLPRGRVVIEATINGFPFRAAFDANGNNCHGLELSKVLLDAADAEPGDMVTVEITRIGDEPVTRWPADLRAALVGMPRAWASWEAITPNARQNWILWLSSGKLEETRVTRIKKVCSMLNAGKKRVCCFGGLSWLRKDHKTAGENWQKLEIPIDDPHKAAKKPRIP
jgi:hypothetical protein